MGNTATFRILNEEDHSIKDQISEYDIMGQVERQLGFLRESQLYHEMRNEEINQAALMGLAQRQAQLESEMNVLDSGLSKKMQSKIQVLTGERINVKPIDNLRSIVKESLPKPNINAITNKKTTIIGTILKPVISNRFKFRKSIAYLLSKASNVDIKKYKMAL
jgi:hypothetical protein